MSLDDTGHVLDAPARINIERQSVSDEEEAEAMFKKYLLTPRQWNRYARGINNPLSYTDPNGKNRIDW
jgi:hypothetical protein